MHVLPEAIRRSLDGDFVGAADLLGPAFAATGDWTTGFLLLQQQCRMLVLAGAQAALRRLAELHPNAIPMLDTIWDCFQAEALCLARRMDPDFVHPILTISPDPPSASALLRIKAYQAVARRDAATAVAILAEIERLRPRTPGRITTRTGDVLEFADLLDADGLTGATFPYYLRGHVFDVAFADLRSVTLARIEHELDRLWQPIELSTVHGVRGRGHTPMLYPSSTLHAAPWIRLGRETRFDHGAGYTLAVGVRDFWLIRPDGERQIFGMPNIHSITFLPV